jgi:hypothetical protein
MPTVAQSDYDTEQQYSWSRIGVNSCSQVRQPVKVADNSLGKGKGSQHNSVRYLPSSSSVKWQAGTATAIFYRMEATPLPCSARQNPTRFFAATKKAVSAAKKTAE